MSAIIVKDGDALEVVQEAFWLAWQACGSPLGMGILRDKPNATKEDVFANIAVRGDYPFAPKPAKGEFYADYVFGRMLKLRLILKKGNKIEFSDDSPQQDYQAWCTKYAAYADIIKAAAMSVGAKIE